MFRHSALIVLVFLLAASVPTLANEQQITLREQLGKEWQREFLTYPFSAPQGACVSASVTLTGPQGPLPVQLLAVERWPDTEHVRSAQVAFVTSLGSLATDTYTLRYGPQPVPDRPRANLAVTPAADRVEISTAEFSVTLLLGERRYDPPAPATEVPGPVLQLRLPDGGAFGGSRLFGPDTLTSYRATLLESGPVVARVEYLYEYAEGNTLRLLATITAGDNAILWDADVREDRPDSGVDFLLSNGLPPLVFPVKMEFFTRREVFLESGARVGDQVELNLAEHAPGLVTKLTPWEDWWDDYTQTTIRLLAQGTGRELQISRRDPGAWVVPLAPGTLRDWGAWQHKLMPVERGEDGVVYLRLNTAQGERKWSFSVDPLAVGQELNAVKDYVLTWEGAAGTHPRLYMNAEEMAAVAQRHRNEELLSSLRPYWATPPPDLPSYHDNSALGAYLMTGDPELAAEARLAHRLRRSLALFGKFDLMRSTFGVAACYDALIDSDLVPDEERDLLRARMAYLGYVIADPATWSAERGYRSYNLNMTVAHVLNRGLIAATLPEHPLAREWAEPALAMLEDMLSQVGPGGEWGESVSNYIGVTATGMLVFAIAAERAGFHDYVNDPRMKRLLDAMAKMYTPPDPRGDEPRRPGARALPPHGRGGAGGRDALNGVMARATRDSDPQFSREQQWAWMQTGPIFHVHDSRMGGQEYAYLDPTLPFGTPDWGSELHPLASAVFRHGLDTAHEHQLNLVVGDFSHAIFAGETGGIASLFSYGVPLAGTFAGGYAERDDLLTSTVSLAREVGEGAERRNRFGFAGFPYNLEESATGKRVVTQLVRFGEQEGIANASAFSALPRQDYVAVDIGLRYARGWAGEAREDLPAWPPVPAWGQPPLDWRRQVLFLKDDSPAGPSYFLFRDTVQGLAGEQPTIWQMWTVSDALGTPADMQNAEAVLAQSERESILPARELVGDRFTALGQWGVDVEYFIAAPADTPRHTLRWGTGYTYTPIYRFKEHKDLLHLQMPGDGAYFVALYPRPRHEPAPSFSRVGNGHIIRTSGGWGTDWGFLSALPVEDEGDRVRFQGTAASVQQRGETIILALGAAGEVRYQAAPDRAYGLSAAFPVSLRVRPDLLLLELPPDHEGGEVRLVLPAGIRLHPEAQARALAGPAGEHLLEVPAGTTRLVLAQP